MSFGNKDNGREYINRTSSNPSKMQSMNNCNINSSHQYSNSNSGENYSYDMKAQRSCNSPKQSSEIHSNNQQNTNIREHYQYKNDSVRSRHYPNKYSNDRPNYYNQQSNSPIDVPDIDQLKEFIKEQSEHFKFELAKYEDRKSCSPSPRSNYHQDQAQQRSQQRPSIGQNRNMSGMSTSNSLGTIACSNSNFSNVSFASTTMSNLDKQTNSYQNKSNYNKPVQSAGKSNNLLTRNLSHDETFSKAPTINKNRVSSPNNILEKSSGNKSQFINTSNAGGPRQENKSDMNKSNKFPPFTSTSGSYHVTSQQNTNNSVTAFTNAKINQQARPNISAIANNIKNVASNSYDTHKNSIRINGDSEPVRPHRVEVRVPDNMRRTSNSGNTTDSQDVEYGTPDSPASPCSLRSSQTDEIRNGLGPRPAKKTL